jgi:aquaporin Z
MTAFPPQVLAEPFDAVATTAIGENSEAIGKYALELLGTFCLLVTVGVTMCTANPFAALGVGAVLMAMIYAGAHQAGAHFNPAITLGALLWGRISLRAAAGHWCAQFAAGLCAVLAWHVIVDPQRIAAASAITLSGRPLMAALAAEALFTLVLSYVVFSCATAGRKPSNPLSDFAVGVAVIAGAVDVGALLGDVFMVSQIIAGATAGIAFLTFGSADR